ncbi:MAG: hypothetical protein AB7V13_10670, partial [Pseudorhodoplanes sp.]
MKSPAAMPGFLFAFQRSAACGGNVLAILFYSRRRHFIPKNQSLDLGAAGTVRCPLVVAKPVFKSVPIGRGSGECMRPVTVPERMHGGLFVADQRPDTRR